MGQEIHCYNEGCGITYIYYGPGRPRKCRVCRGKRIGGRWFPSVEVK